MATILGTLNKIINRQINRHTLYSKFGWVKKVNEAERTCEVNTSDGLTYFNVNLQGFAGSKIGMVQMPTIDSQVIITFLTDTESFISAFSGVDKIFVDIDKNKFYISKTDGFTLQKNSSGLKKTLTDLCDKLIAFKVITPAGQGVTDPTSITDLTTIKTDLNNYLKD